MESSKHKASIKYWTKNIIVTYGGSKKDPAIMTAEEKKAQMQESIRLVKERNFKHGQPIVYEIGGRTVKEFEDGTLIFLSPE